MKTGKCLIIYNEPAEDALPDELDVLDQVNFIDNTLQSLGYRVERRGITENFFREIEEIAGDDIEFVFNLVESVGQKAEILYFIPALLNMHHIPYTGCPVEAAFVTGSKVLAPGPLMFAQQPRLVDLPAMHGGPLVQPHDHHRQVRQVDAGADAEGEQDLARAQITDAVVVASTHSHCSITSAPSGSARRWARRRAANAAL